MTKFEEELRNKGVEIFTHMDGCTISKKVCINYADVVNLSEGWVSPEEHQARVDELIEAKEKYTKLLYENSSLKSQLQQQALPVVPECVAKFINTKLDKSKNLQDLYDEPLFHTGENYLADDEYDFIHWFNENTTLFEKAWTNGFTVEKPQLFYLKNKLTTSYLALDTNTGYYEHWGEEIIPKSPIKQGYKIAFTQQEIDIMNTGSYEQIEVEK